MTINCKGHLLDLSSPKIMGILNVTPDSFYDGGINNSIDAALQQAEKMLQEGADIIDIGGMSSRPNAAMISEEEELQRVLPIVREIVKVFPDVIVSIDTFRSTVAKKCIEAGASIVNDISAGNMDVKMFEVVANLKCPYIMMHMQGTPVDMQDNPQYNNITLDIIKEMSSKINQLKAMGVADIIIDPGFGFGKTIEHNYQLLRELDTFNHVLQVPLLAGLSRKSMLWKVIEKSPQDALSATIAANTLALNNGAKILRVHDVAAAKDTIRIFEQYKMTNE